MPSPNDNDPAPPGTFSGTIAGFFNSIFGAPAPSTSGVATKAQYYGQPGSDAGAGSTTKAQYYGTTTLAPVTVVPKVASTSSPLAAFKASLDAHQLHLANTGQYAALRPTLDRHELVLAGRAGLNAKLGVSAKPAPATIARPVSHATTGSTSAGKSSATTAAGTAASSLGGPSGTAEVLLIAAAVFVVFVLIAKRKKKR